MEETFFERRQMCRLNESEKGSGRKSCTPTHDISYSSLLRVSSISRSYVAVCDIDRELYENLNIDFSKLTTPPRNFRSHPHRFASLKHRQLQLEEVLKISLLFTRNFDRESINATDHAAKSSGAHVATLVFLPLTLLILSVETPRDFVTLYTLLYFLFSFNL